LAARPIVSGNLDHSFFRAESVGEMIARRGPLTAEIAVLSVILSWLVGVPVAIVSALKPSSLGDNVARFLSTLFLAVPGFWLGMLIVRGLLFAFGYRAPLAGASLFADPIANLQIVIGPAVVLGLGQAAYIARMARSSLLEVIREDYVRTARARRLVRRSVERRDRAEEAPCIGMARRLEKCLGTRLLDLAAGIHDDDPVGVFGDDAHVVGDEDDRGAEIFL
jgi:peptide/nickel transport system permease protein